MLSSVTNFTVRQDSTALKNMDSQPVKAMDFYQRMIHRFYWSESLEARIKANSPTKKHIIQDFVMAGLRYPVYGEPQGEVRDRWNRTVETYHFRANTPHYGYHDDSMLMASCF